MNQDYTDSENQEVKELSVEVTDTEIATPTDTADAKPAPEGLKKPKHKLDKGIITLFIMIAVILLGYGGYRLYKYNSGYRHEFAGISYTTPKEGLGKTTNFEGTVSSCTHEVPLNSGTVEITIDTYTPIRKFSLDDFKNFYNIKMGIYHDDVSWINGTPGFTDKEEYWAISNTGIIHDTNTWYSYRAHYDKNNNKIATITLVAPMSAAEDAAQIMATVKYYNK